MEYEEIIGSPYHYCPARKLDEKTICNGFKHYRYPNAYPNRSRVISLECPNRQYNENIRKEQCNG